MNSEKKILLTIFIAGLLALLWAFCEWLGFQIKEGFRGY